MIVAELSPGVGQRPSDRKYLKKKKTVKSHRLKPRESISGDVETMAAALCQNILKVVSINQSRFKSV